MLPPALGYDGAMGRLGGVVAILSCAACEASIEGPPARDGTDEPAAWSSPMLVVGSGIDEDDATPSAAVLEVIFSYADPGDDDRKHLYAITRSSTRDAWSDPQPLPFNAIGSTDQTPRLSADGLTLYFASTRDPATDGLDIWQVTRPSLGGPWGTPTQIAELVDPDDDDKWFSPCANGRYVMISERDGGEDIYEGVLGGGPPARVDALSSRDGETGTWISADCTLVYFASTRSDDNRIYTATRPAADAPWPEPVLVEDFLALGGDQEDPWLSTDRRTFVFVSDVRGSKDVYIATR